MGNKKNRWISVKTRLPESHEKVLTFNSYGTIEFDIYRAIGGWQLCECVTHWRPLPEPPPPPKAKEVKEPKPPRYKRMKEEHRCVRCKEPLPDGYTKARCPECMGKNRAYVQEHYKGKCRRCGCEVPPNYKYVLCKKCRIKVSQERYEKKQRKEDENAVGQRSFEKC